MEELIKELREYAKHAQWQAPGKAADALEAQQARIAELREALVMTCDELLRLIECLTDPTAEMIEAGAQRLVQWEDGCAWPDSWSALDVAAACNEAERCWRSMAQELMGPNYK